MNGSQSLSATLSANLNPASCGPAEIEIQAFQQPAVIDTDAERSRLEELFETCTRAAAVPHVHQIYGVYARAVAQLSRWMETKDGHVYHDDCLKVAAKVRKAEQKETGKKVTELEAARARAAKVVAEMDAEKAQIGSALATQTERHAAARAQLANEEKSSAFAIIEELGGKKAHEIYVRAGAAKERNENVFGNWLKVLTHFVAWQQETSEGRSYTESLKPRAPAPRKEWKERGPDYKQLGMGLGRFSKKPESTPESIDQVEQRAATQAKPKLSKADRAQQDRDLRNSMKSANGGSGKKKGK